MQDNWDVNWQAVEALATAVAAGAALIALWAAIHTYRAAVGQARSASIQLNAALESVKVDVITRKADHERRQMEATLLQWADVQEVFSDHWKTSLEILGTDELTKSSVAEIVTRSRNADVAKKERMKYAELQNSLRRYLNRMERLAIAVEKEVLSFEMIDDLGNTIVRHCWRDSQAYIELIRQGAPPGSRQYDALERLNRRLEEAVAERTGREAVNPLHYRPTADTAPETVHDLTGSGSAQAEAAADPDRAPQ